MPPDCKRDDVIQLIVLGVALKISQHCSLEVFGIGFGRSHGRGEATGTDGRSDVVLCHIRIDRLCPSEDWEQRCKKECDVAVNSESLSTPHGFALQCTERRIPVFLYLPCLQSGATSVPPGSIFSNGCDSQR